jgi:hypothetical protein
VKTLQIACFQVIPAQAKKAALEEATSEAEQAVERRRSAGIPPARRRYGLFG